MTILENGIESKISMEETATEIKTTVTNVESKVISRGWSEHTGGKPRKENGRMDGILIVILTRFWLLWSALAILILCAIADMMYMRKKMQKLWEN